MIQRVNVDAPRRAALGAWLRSALRAITVQAEPVEVVEQRFNFLPQRFRWRGNLWCVRLVVRVWEQQHRAGAPPRRYYEVVCQGGGNYVLFQDLQVGTWHLSV